MILAVEIGILGKYINELGHDGPPQMTSFNHPPAVRSVEPRPEMVAQLRDATRAEHDAIEASLGLLHPSLTLGAYRRIIERFHGYYQPLELALQRTPGLVELGLDLPRRLRTPLLRRDLEALVGPPVEDLPTCHALPVIDGVSAALGCLYVLEGASLGGQVITRHVRATLGVTPGHGCAFFFGDGEQTRAHWKGFVNLLERFGAVHPDAHAGVLVAAIATFQTLRCWWEGASA